MRVPPPSLPRARVRGLLGALTLSLVCAQLHAGQLDRKAPEHYGALWWNITNGLPQSSINALVQTASGELWIATHGGLLCFDGIEFQRFDLDTLEGLRSNRITALCEDGAEGLWFTTREGRLHHLENGRLSTSEDVPGQAGLLALLRAGDGSLWTQGADGSVRRFLDGAWSELIPAGGEGHYRGLCLRSDGVVGVAARDELVLFDASGRERSRLTAPTEILALAPGPGDVVWIGLTDGVARAQATTLARFRAEPAIDQPVNVLADDGQGSLWLGTPSGATRLATTASATTGVRVSSSTELPRGFDVRSIVLDREENAWLGGGEAGLMRLRPLRIASFQTSPGKAVTALCDDGEDGAWIAYATGELEHLDPESRRGAPVTLDTIGSEPPTISALMHDRRGRTWVGVNDSWMRQDARQGEAFASILVGRISSGTVGPMAELPNGEVWLSTSAGHLVRVGAEDEVREELDLHAPIHALAAAPDGSLWVGGENQVFHVKAGQVSRFTDEHGVPPGSIRDLLPEANGDVWMASYGGGLVLLANGRARRLARREGLFDSSLTRILFADHERLWILSNLGLMVAERADLMAVFDGRSARLDPVVIGPEAGMNEASFGGPAGFRNAAGQMWFGTIAGAVRVDAASFPFNRNAPAARIQLVRAEELALAPVDDLEIPAGARRVLFEFTAFSLTAPARMRFRYRLDGYDEAWSDSGPLRSAAYTGLAPGVYTFRVMARNEDGVWSTEPQSLQLEVMPAWWQTRIFRIVTALAAVGSLIGLHRLRVRVLERRTRVLLEATEGRARAEEHSSRLREELAHVARVATAGELATSLAHEVNQPLAAIVTNAEAGRRFLARGKVDLEELDAILRDIAQQGEHAAAVIHRLRQFLRKHDSELSVLAVNALVRETVPLVRRELQDHSVELALELAEDLPSILADPIQIQQVLVNLIKNACEAMANHAGDRRIRLRTCGAEHGIVLEVHDTGPGFSPDVFQQLFQPYVTTKAGGMGLGLAICRSIVEAHGGRLGAESSDGTGAKFRMELPTGGPRAASA